MTNETEKYFIEGIMKLINKNDGKYYEVYEINTKKFTYQSNIIIPKYFESFVYTSNPGISIYDQTDHSLILFCSLHEHMNDLLLLQMLYYIKKNQESVNDYTTLNFNINKNNKELSIKNNKFGEISLIFGDTDKLSKLLSEPFENVNKIGNINGEFINDVIDKVKLIINTN